MNDLDEGQNMVSNLPLIFANGYPASLEKITEKQLENFIPFMVQCSLGHINHQAGGDVSEPEWWPEDVPFTIPFSKPENFEGNWLNKMKEIVVICYQFHESVFLLRFCNDLASYEHARLRFINNYNSTTSLYDRHLNKLIVTFRNENMFYDQPQKNRKSLLQQKSRFQNEDSNTQQMVEPALFEIYLCDNCDAELYSLEAIKEHEKTCNSDDDVIICSSPISEISSTHGEEKEKCNNEELKQNFLINFGLENQNILSSLNKKNIVNVNKISKDIKIHKSPKKSTTSLEKLKRLPRRNRGIYALSRCPIIALSSPAGQLMIKHSKTLMTEDYLYERLDRMERFCHAPQLSENISRPKFLDKKYSSTNVSYTFKKPINYTLHTYTFPRRQFSSKYRMESFLFFNSLLLKRCRPITVRLKKLNDNEYLKQKSNVVDNMNTNINIRLKRENVNSAKWKVAANQALGANVIDTIDLCSSDDENTENCTNLSDKTHLNSEVTITRISRPNENNFANLSKQNTFEGNFLVSQTSSNKIKPLQPSVFLFSNYTTKKGISVENFSPTITDGQIQHLQNHRNVNNIVKNSNEDWLTPSTNHIESNEQILHIMDMMGKDKDVAINNRITSPNRIISIDLTL